MNAGIVVAIIVILEVFSGRPNPEWTLTPAQQKEFERQLAILPVLGGRSADPEEQLGYHGFKLRGLEDPIRVYCGEVSRGRETLADPGRKLEYWLLDSGRLSLDARLVAYVEAEIARSP